jgi:hypothetical protein
MAKLKPIVAQKPHLLPFNRCSSEEFSSPAGIEFGSLVGQSASGVVILCHFSHAQSIRGSMPAIPRDDMICINAGACISCVHTFGVHERIKNYAPNVEHAMLFWCLRKIGSQVKGFVAAMADITCTTAA